jgi:hypothetical protein
VFWAEAAKKANSAALRMGHSACFVFTSQYRVRTAFAQARHSTQPSLSTALGTGWHRLQAAHQREASLP